MIFCKNSFNFLLLIFQIKKIKRMVKLLPSPSSVCSPYDRPINQEIRC